MKSLSDSYVHLTNYSINKNCQEYVANEDATRCQGHKWFVATADRRYRVYLTEFLERRTLKCLWRYLEERGVDVGEFGDVAELLISQFVVSNALISNNPD